MSMPIRSFVYSSLGQRAIPQLLFGTMFGSPQYKWQLKYKLFRMSNYFSFLLFLTYSFYAFFDIREYEN